MLENKNINKKQENEEKKKLVFRAGVSPNSSTPRIGPLRSHLYNYAFAKNEAQKGKDSKIIFRVDDTDEKKHSREVAMESFRFFSEDLGMKFDVNPINSNEKIGQSVFQSERQEIYARYVEELFDKHIAFIDKSSGLVLFDIKKFIEQYSDVLEIDDVLNGEIKFLLENNLKRGQLFFPIMRSNKNALYHLASVVDDETLGVTHIVRGQDKLSIAEFQEMVRISLGFEPKKYLHTPMLLGSRGELLKGAVKFNDFIQRGIIPHALLSYMISSGYGNPEEVYPSLEKFVEYFDYTKIHKNNGKFDLSKLENINKKLIRQISPDIYLDSIILFLLKNNHGVLAEKLKNDIALSGLLVFLRKEPSESLEIVKSILNPQYEEISEEIKYSVGILFDFFKKTDGEFPSAEKLDLDRKSMYDGIRWILVGKCIFPNIEKVFDYLKLNNLVNDRINLASNFLNK